MRKTLRKEIIISIISGFIFGIWEMIGSEVAKCLKELLSR